MLERKEGKVGETRDVMAGGVDPEDAALIAGAIAVVVHERGHGPSMAEGSAGQVSRLAVPGAPPEPRLHEPREAPVADLSQPRHLDLQHTLQRQRRPADD